MQIKDFRLVGNAVDLKGNGLIFVGDGKSSTSVFLTLLYKDVFLVADDYTDCLLVTDIDRFVPEDVIESEAGRCVAFREQLVNEVISTASREACGKLRMNLYAFVQEGEQHQEFYAKNFGIRNSKLDELRKESRYIDTITQRVAHKEWMKANYIIFLLSYIFSWDHFLGLLDEYYTTHKIEDKEERKQIGDYLAQKFFTIKNNVATPRKNSYITESDPEWIDVLLYFVRSIDDRGDNWEGLFDGTQLKFMVFLYYDDIMAKVREIYEIIPKAVVKAILDYREQSIKFRPEEED